MNTIAAIVSDFVDAKVESGLSLTRIAREWEVSRRQLSRYCSHENAPSDQVMDLIAEDMRPKVVDFGFFPVSPTFTFSGETVFSRAAASGRVIYGHVDFPNLLVVFSANDNRAYIGIRDSGIDRIAGSCSHEIAFGSLLQTVTLKGEMTDLDALFCTPRNRKAIMRGMHRVEIGYMRYLTGARNDMAMDLFSARPADYAAECSIINSRIAELTEANTISQSGMNRMTRARRQINAKLRTLR